jgi:hypothetical protein
MEINRQNDPEAQRSSTPASTASARTRPASEKQIKAHLAALSLFCQHQAGLSEDQSRLKLSICADDLRGVSEPVLALACRRYRASQEPGHRFFHLGTLLEFCREAARDVSLWSLSPARRAPLALAAPESEPVTIPNGDFEALRELIKQPDDYHPLAIGPRNEAEIVQLAQRRAEALERREAETDKRLVR